MIDYGLFRVLSIREIALLRIPEMGSDIVRDITGLYVENFPHAGQSDAAAWLQSIGSRVEKPSTSSTTAVCLSGGQIQIFIEGAPSGPRTAGLSVHVALT